MAAQLRIRIEGVVEQRAAKLYRPRVLETAETKPRRATEKPVTPRQLMWNVMRGPTGRNGFSAADLVRFGSTDTSPVTLRAAKTYIRNLADAGYLHAFEPHGTKAPTTWRLKPSMNSGPKPPAILRARIIWDQNRERIIGDVIAAEEPS